MKLNENVNTALQGRSQFDLSYDSVLSATWGDLVPVVMKEMVPGDTFTCDTSAFVRLAPLASPTYGKIHGYVNYFFVPNRILLANNLWEDFIRGGVDGKTSYTLPYCTSTQLRSLCGQFMNADTDDYPSEYELYNDLGQRMRKLFTYLGLYDPNKYQSATDLTAGMHFSLLPFLAYNRIYGDYYFPWGLDNDSTAELNYYFKASSGRFNGHNLDVLASTMGLDGFSLKKACFKKDYYTTAQIDPQRGLSVFAPLTAASDANSNTIVQPDNVVTNSAGGVTSSISALGMKLANSLQKFLERNNIAGARYFEQILARFGVKIDAERLQRSEYLGGNDFYINISDVTATASTLTSDGDIDTSLGEMAGKGIGLGKSGITYNAQDYGFFVGILHLMPESGFVQGLPRMFTREDRFDYFTPEMEETGMQPIYNAELVQDNYLLASPLTYNTLASTGVFGYIPRYAEYKYSAPILAGDFRLASQNQHTNVMNSMHLFRFIDDDGDVTSIESLNSDFVTLTTDRVEQFNRIFQDTSADYDHFWINCQVKLGAIRPMLGYIEASTAFTNEDKGRKVNLPAYGVRL